MNAIRAEKFAGDGGGNKQINQSKQTHNKSETKEQQQKASEKETQRWGAGLRPVPGDPRHHPTVGARKLQPLHPHPLHGASPPKCPDPPGLSPQGPCPARPQPGSRGCAHTRGTRMGRACCGPDLAKKSRDLPRSCALAVPRTQTRPSPGSPAPGGGKRRLQNAGTKKRLLALTAPVGKNDAESGAGWARGGVAATQGPPPSRPQL